MLSIFWIDMVGSLDPKPCSAFGAYQVLEMKVQPRFGTCLVLSKVSGLYPHGTGLTHMSRIGETF